MIAKLLARDLRESVETARALGRQWRYSGGSDKADAKDYFEQRNLLMPDASDRNTMSASTTALYSALHYATLEKMILEFLRGNASPVASPSVLGTGTGHWIRFYLNALEASHVTGVDIAPSAIKRLEGKFPKTVSLHAGDFSEMNLGEKFDIVNCIGTIHHITDDESWRRCVKNIAAHLKPGGHAFVSDRLGLFSLNDLYTRPEQTTWEKPEMRRGSPQRELNHLLMRGRSRSLWRQAVSDAGCCWAGVRTFRPFLSGMCSRFNVLMFSRNKS